MKITNEIIIEKAKKQGFDLIGFSPADELTEETRKLEKWLGENFHAGMEYMGKNIEKRKNVKSLLPYAKSVISLGLNYYTPVNYSDERNKGKISRYAWGKDYHLVIWKKLDKLVDEIKKTDNNFEAKSYVDTGPVMDKSWAVKSGIGWLGKHTNVINKEIGSWFFIANLITNFEFNYSLPIEDFCGSCRACIDACPTNAIIDEYVLDSNKCISYLTIENKKDIPEKYKGKFENWIFGCDICQDVCPWNIKFSRNTDIAEFFPVKDNKEIDLDKVISFSKDEFNKRFKESPVKRAKLAGLKRNAAFIQ